MMIQQLRNIIAAISVLLISTNLNAQDELRILPLGNSITQGYIDVSTNTGYQVGYRLVLYNQLNAAGYDYSFVGNASSGEILMPVEYTSYGGRHGIRSHQLADVMTDGYFWDPNISDNVDIVYPHGPFLEAYPADLILLHIGSNDVYWDNSDDVGAITDILNAVDDYETENNTEVLVIVARIIGNRDVGAGNCNDNQIITDFNTNLENLVNARISAGDKLKLIDMQCSAGLDYDTDMRDDVHPKQSGYDKMGQKWFTAIDEIHDAPEVSQVMVDAVDEGNSFPAIDLKNYVTDDYTTPADMEWVLTSEPTNLDITINPDNTLSVAPKDPEWSGSESVYLKVFDKGRYIERLKKSDILSISFTVNPVNDPPEIVSQLQTYNKQEDSDIYIFLSHLEVEDIDNPPGHLSLNILDGENYTVDGSKVSPVENFNGPLEIAVTVSDQESESDPFMVQAYFSPVNDVPVIDSSRVVRMLSSAKYKLSFDDIYVTDPDDSQEELSLIVWGGVNYSLGINDSIQPTSGLDDTIYVNVQVSDGLYTTDFYQVMIDVTRDNQPPYFTQEYYDTTINAEDLFNITVQVVDPNGDPVTLEADLPDFLQFIPATKIILGAPGHDDDGSYEIIITASDDLDETYVSFTLTVEDPLGIEFMQEGKVTLYPNPAEDVLNIQLSEVNQVNNIMITDLMGRAIKTVDPGLYSLSEIEVNISDIAKGSYLLMVQHDNYISHQKFVVGAGR